MAEIQGSTLLNCNYIPDVIAPGSIMMFENTTAPTSWTKITTFNDTAVRIVSGSVSNGGSSSFSNIFTSRTVFNPSTTSGTSSFSLNPAIGNASYSATSVGVSINPSSFPESIHSHTYNKNNIVQRYYSGAAPSITIPQSIYTSTQTSPTGSSTPHSHSVTVPNSTHNHPSGDNSPHTHSFSWAHSHAMPTVSQNVSVYSVDVILASKN